MEEHLIALTLEGVSSSSSDGGLCLLVGVGGGGGISFFLVGGCDCSADGSIENIQNAFS